MLANLKKLKPWNLLKHKKVARKAANSCIRQLVPHRTLSTATTARPSECLVMPGGDLVNLPSKKMASGAEADLYRLGTRAIAKILRTPTDHWAEKAEWAVENRARFSVAGKACVAWPTRTLHDPQTRRTIGVVLPFLEGYVPLAAVLDPTLRRRLCPHWDAAALVVIAANLFTAYDWLHARGVVHGDGSAQNAMVNRAGRVTLIDCDSSQYDTGNRVLTCGVTTGDYCPPELQPLSEAEMNAFVRSPSQDTFSATVVALQLLNGAGSHPYSGRWDKSDGSRAPATEKRIEINAWSGARVGPSVGKVAPPRASLPLSALGPQIEQLAREAIDGGWKSPDARPPLQDWVAALRRLRRSLRPCVANDRHAYDRRLAACPFCEVKRRAGVELFPRPPRKGLRNKPDSGWATSS